MYEFTHLSFRYFPTHAATDNPGIVFLGWEPNANRQGPSDDARGVQVINAFEHHTQGPIWSPGIVLTVPVAHLPPPRYCRYAPTSSDLNLYDTGSLIVGTDGCNVTTQIGYVEVQYTIRFYNYHLENTLLSQSRVASATLDDGLNPDRSVFGAIVPMIPTFVEAFGEKAANWVTGTTWVPKAGKYLFRALVNMYNDGTGGHQQLVLKKGGSDVLTSEYSVTANEVKPHLLTGLIESDGTTPFQLEMRGQTTNVQQKFTGNLDLMPAA